MPVAIFSSCGNDTYNTYAVEGGTCVLRLDAEASGAEITPPGAPLGAQSFGECCARCVAEAACGAFTFDPYRRQCWLNQATGYEVVPSGDGVFAGMSAGILARA